MGGEGVGRAPAQSLEAGGLTTWGRLLVLGAQEKGKRLEAEEGVLGARA